MGIKDGGFQVISQRVAREIEGARERVVVVKLEPTLKPIVGLVRKRGYVVCHPFLAKDCVSVRRGV